MKNIQIQIILIFTILGIAIMIGLGVFFINQLSFVAPNGELNESIAICKQMIIFGIGVFVIIATVVGIFVRKLIIKPMHLLTKNAMDIAEGKMVDTSLLFPEKVRTDMDELVNAFYLMSNELSEKFNEAIRQKKQIETILLHMTDGVIAFNLNGEIIHINPAARQLMEIDENENTFDKIFGREDVNINIEKVIYLENWTSTEQKLNINNRYVNVLFAPFKDENERPCGVIAVIQDITEHVKLDNMRKEFVADVSHELKTPITSIMGYSDTLLEGEYDKEIQNKFLNVISEEAKRMARLVNDLLTLSRYDNKENKCEKVEFDLAELVKKTRENLDLEIKKKNHQIECFETSEVPMVYADKFGIERVIINILTNSIKYTPDGGIIKIYVGFVYNDAYVKIIDNGIGIPEQDLSRIFERFYRVDKARTRAMGGTGLGLAIAKEILDQNNGSIDIKSIQNKGTEVVIRVPIKSEKDKKKKKKTK